MDCFYFWQIFHLNVNVKFVSLSLLLLRFDIRPSYGEVNEAEPTCLLRTCDQYITGRDLTYERALEIVQNEEYLVAVDADLIRRRQDYATR